MVTKRGKAWLFLSSWQHLIMIKMSFIVSTDPFLCSCYEDEKVPKAKTAWLRPYGWSWAWDTLRKIIQECLAPSLRFSEPQKAVISEALGLFYIAEVF